MITITLIRPQVPENIGFICRTMANFGLKKLLLVDPLCDPLDEQAIKTSSHAKDILEKAKIITYKKYLGLRFDARIGTTAVLGTDYNLPRTPLYPDLLPKLLGKKGNYSIIFGNEASGLSNDEVKNCDFIITIPTSRKYKTLNISHAAAIIFYELFKIKNSKEISEDYKSISSKEKEIIMARFKNILDELDFHTPEKKETQLITWKRVFGKSMMSKRESFVVLGFLKKLEELVTKRKG